MKKKIVFLLTLLLTLTLAGAALANTEDRMKDMVQTYLDENGQDYVYDDYVFTLKLAIGSALSMPTSESLSTTICCRLLPMHLFR